MPEATAVELTSVMPDQAPPEGCNTLTVKRTPTSATKPPQEIEYRWKRADNGGGRWEPAVAGFPPIPDTGIKVGDVSGKGKWHAYTVTGIRVRSRPHR